MKITDAKFRPTNVLKSALELGFEIDTTESFESVIESAESFIKDHGTAERHECEVQSLGNHDQRVDFGDFWSQGEIVNFSSSWSDSPDTEVDHESFVDNDGQLIQLFYRVGETDYNAPDGFMYSKKLGKHVAIA